MNENQLAENLAYYRKKKGMSQEKVAEYMDVSRQAVTKWEANLSRPSSDNLIKLAGLLEVDVDTLLGNREKAPEPSAGKTPWIFIGISVLCILAYLLFGTVHIGVLICMFILFVPIQLFLHLYFSNAIKDNSFNGIAGFDAKIEYNFTEVKKLLIEIDFHTGVLSAVYIFLLCALNIVDLQMEWLNGILITLYVCNFVLSIVATNYKRIDKIYRREEDKRRARRNLPITAACILLLCVGIGIAFLLDKN